MEVDHINLYNNNNKCIGDATKGAARRSPNCVRKTKKNIILLHTLVKIVRSHHCFFRLLLYFFLLLFLLPFAVNKDVQKYVVWNAGVCPITDILLKTASSQKIH